MKLTPARRRGLEVLAAVQHANRHKRPERQRCRYSNETVLLSDGKEGVIYWQTVNWLEQEGLAARVGFSEVRLTAEGVKLAKAEKLWPS